MLATAGISNPTALPVPPVAAGGPSSTDAGDDRNRPPGDRADRDRADRDRSIERPADGTVNLLVGVDRPLEPGALANLVSVAAEAKAATLPATVGIPQTTNNAVVVGCTPTGTPGSGESATFCGSATPVGAAVRACVRDTLRASLGSRYGPDRADTPLSVVAAEYGVSTDRTAAVSTPAER